MVEYKKGVDNKVANALSRQFEFIPESDFDQLDGKGVPEGCLCLLLVPDPSWLLILKDSYSLDAKIQHIIQSIKSRKALKGFAFQNDLLFYKGGFYLGFTCPLKAQVLHHVYSSPLTGHFGFLKSYQRAKREFF